MTMNVLNPDNKPVSLRVNAYGELLTAGAGGGGGGGGTATLVEQQAQTALLTQIEVNTASFTTNGLTDAELRAAPVPVTDSSAAASLAVIDDWDETDRAKVNLIVGQAGVDGGGGAATAKTVRVILATDSPGGTSGGGGLSSRLIEVSKTRPADTIQYGAGDVIAESTSAATVWTFADCATGNGKGGVIDGLTLVSSVNAATRPDLELYLFDTSVATNHDNVAWAPSDADMEKLVAVIDLPAAYFKAFGSGASGCTREGLGIRFNCAAGATALYGILVVRNAYSPTTSEKFTLRLRVGREP